MGLDVFFRRDAANFLRATAVASESAASVALDIFGESGAGTVTLTQEEVLHIYRQGVRHALVSVGLAFGLEPVGPASQVKREVSPPLAGLLWAETPHER